MRAAPRSPHAARLSAIGAVVGISLLTGAPSALAQTAEYTNTEDRVLGEVVTRPAPGVGSSARPSTLPFTGGELVLLAASGAAAVAAGTAMVVSGRRRGGSAA